MHKQSNYNDYKEAIEGEGWAIMDYTYIISKAKSEKEKKDLTHIRDEEKQHLGELMELMECKAN
jgi:rubrerythrin